MCSKSGGYSNSLKWNLLPYVTADGRNTTGKEKSLVEKNFKAHENVVFKAYDSSLCYSSADTLDKIFESFMLLNQQRQW